MSQISAHGDAAYRNVLSARRASSAPVLDFSAGEWPACPAHAPFVFLQSELPVAEETRVRVLYDDACLYIGIACTLSRPAPEAGLLGYVGEHVEIFLDPANNRQGSIQFAVNASGGASAIDHRQPESTTTRRTWWAGWTTQTRRTGDGWEALVAIPLPHPVTEGAVWGMNVYRCHANLPGPSSWCSYSEGFDMPDEFGNLAFGSTEVHLPVERLPVCWPAEMRKAPEFHLTVDPPDDLLGWALDPERLEGYVRYFADWGVRRVYWIDYGPFTNGYWNKWGRYPQATFDRIGRSMAAFGNDLLPGAVAAAHRVGLELYCEVKPWDWGSCLIYPPDRQTPGEAGLPRVGGLAYPTHVFTEHPDRNMTRSSFGGADDGRAIAEIVLMKNDDGPVPFPVEQLTVWTSADNTNYKRLDGVKVSEGVENAPVLRKTLAGAEETGERRRVRVIRITCPPIADRYVAVDVPGRESKFENRAFALARLLDAEGREIPASIGYLSVNGGWPGGQEGWQEHGIYFEMSGATSEPGGFLTPWALDNPDGVIGLARGRNLLVPGCPEPAHPQAAEWILDWTRRAIACGADGFEFRVRNHQVAMEWEAYGYAPAVQQAFRAAFGRDLRLDGSDFAILSDFRSQCYTGILRRAKALCAAAGIPLGLQITPDLYRQHPDGCTMGIRFDWRTWLRDGIADQMLTKYISPYSPIFRDIREETAKAGIPFYVEFERYFRHPNVDAIYRHFFDTACRAGADAINIYEAANVAEIDDGGITRSKAPAFAEFMGRYRDEMQAGG